MPLRLDLKFSLAYSGWTEVYYSNIDANPETFKQVAYDFGDARIALLCHGATLEEISVRNPAVKFHTAVYTPQQQRLPGLDDEFRDVQDSALFLKMESADRKRRSNHFLRGFPDVEVQYVDNVQQITGRTAELLTPFLTKLLAIRPLIPSASRTPEDTPKAPITQVRPSPNLLRTQIKSPVHTLVGGEVITLKGLKFQDKNVQSRLINRTHTVIPTTDPLTRVDWFEINVSPNGVLDYQYEGNGYWWRRFIKFVPVQFLSMPKFTERNTGRPVVNTRGRKYGKRTNRLY